MRGRELAGQTRGGHGVGNQRSAKTPRLSGRLVLAVAVTLTARLIYSFRISAGRPVVQRDHAQQRPATVDRLEREQPDERLRTRVRAHVLEDGARRRPDK